MMDGVEAEQIGLLLGIIVSSLVIFVAAIVGLLRSGRVVSFPTLRMARRAQKR